MTANDHIEEAGGKAAEGASAAGYHQGIIGDGIFHFCSIFPRDDACFDRCLDLGKVDELNGFKENVIMGHLIPAGSGLPMYRNLRIDTLGADHEKLTPEEAAKRVEGVAIPTAENTQCGNGFAYSYARIDRARTTRYCQLADRLRS